MSTTSLCDAAEELTRNPYLARSRFIRLNSLYRKGHRPNILTIRIYMYFIIPGLLWIAVLVDIFGYPSAKCGNTFKERKTKVNTHTHTPTRLLII